MFPVASFDTSTKMLLSRRFSAEVSEIAFVEYLRVLYNGQEFYVLYMAIRTRVGAPQL
jgi:hypothetical protein